MNYSIEIEKNVFYKPILLAASKGNIECLEIILKNKTLDINTFDDQTGVNAFWISAFYGHGKCMNMLAETGIDIYNKHNKLGTNALHVSLINKHYSVAS